MILRMGAFHTSMTFLAVIGKRLTDAALSDIFIEADIVAAGSVPGVLEGRQYNGAMRAHNFFMKAMQRFRMKSFKE